MAGLTPLLPGLSAAQQQHLVSSLASTQLLRMAHQPSFASGLHTSLRLQLGRYEGDELVAVLRGMAQLGCLPGPTWLEELASEAFFTSAEMEGGDDAVLGMGIECAAASDQAGTGAGDAAGGPGLLVASVSRLGTEERPGSSSSSSSLPPPSSGLYAPPSLAGPLSSPATPSGPLSSSPNRGSYWGRNRSSGVAAFTPTCDLDPITNPLTSNSGTDCSTGSSTDCSTGSSTSSSTGSSIGSSSTSLALPPSNPSASSWPPSPAASFRPSSPPLPPLLPPGTSESLHRAALAALLFATVGYQPSPAELSRMKSLLCPRLQQLSPLDLTQLLW